MSDNFEMLGERQADTGHRSIVFQGVLMEPEVLLKGLFVGAGPVPHESAHRAARSHHFLSEARPFAAMEENHGGGTETVHAPLGAIPKG